MVQFRHAGVDPPLNRQSTSACLNCTSFDHDLIDKMVSSSTALSILSVYQRVVCLSHVRSSVAFPHPNHLLHDYNT
jgi:hypothetical protein